MILGIVGTRHEPKDRKLIIEKIIGYYCLFGNVTEIVSGGATGVDEIAKNIAISKDLKYTEFHPDNEEGATFGIRCYKRNRKIAIRVDTLLSFPCEHSRGTIITENLMKDLGKMVYPYPILCKGKQK